MGFISNLHVFFLVIRFKLSLKFFNFKVAMMPRGNQQLGNYNCICNYYGYSCTQHGFFKVDTWQTFNKYDIKIINK